MYLYCYYTILFAFLHMCGIALIFIMELMGLQLADYELETV